jgi:hypothetical protein
MSIIPEDILEILKYFEMYDDIYNLIKLDQYSDYLPYFFNFFLEKKDINFITFFFGKDYMYIKYIIDFYSDSDIEYLKFLTTKFNIDIINHDYCLSNRACVKNNLELLKFLIKKGLKIPKRNSSMMYFAIQNNSEEVFKFLLEKYENVNDEENNIFKTLLQFKRLNLIELLFKHGYKFKKSDLFILNKLDKTFVYEVISKYDFLMK